MSVFFLEPLRASEERMWKCLMEDSWRTFHQHQLLATGGMSVTVSSASQVMAQRDREARGMPGSLSYTAVVPGRGGEGGGWSRSRS